MRRNTVLAKLTRRCCSPVAVFCAHRNEAREITLHTVSEDERVSTSALDPDGKISRGVGRGLALNMPSVQISRRSARSFAREMPRWRIRLRLMLPSCRAALCNDRHSTRSSRTRGKKLQVVGAGLHRWRRPGVRASAQTQSPGAVRASFVAIDPSRSLTSPTSLTSSNLTLLGAVSPISMPAQRPGGNGAQRRRALTKVESGKQQSLPWQPRNTRSGAAAISDSQCSPVNWSPRHSERSRPTPLMLSYCLNIG